MDVLVDVLGLVAGVEADLLGGVRHPGMLKDGLKTDPVLGPDAETGEDKVLTLRGQAGHSEPHIGRADLLVLLEGDVAADHVVQEDAQGPDGGGLGVVLGSPDPLGRRVHSGPVKVSVNIVL